MENLVIKVENVIRDGEKPKMLYKQEIKCFTRLGREIRITPKSNIAVNKEGYTAQYLVPTISINIEIGRAFSADLVMTEEAWKALNQGAEIRIQTTEQYKKFYEARTK